MRHLRIVFMGTPEFAVPSLEGLVENGFEVAAVVTAADAPARRGREGAVATAVKKRALAYGIPVLQPASLKSPEFLEELRSYQANLQVVVAFRRLPEGVWAMPEYGTFNLHGSLLPKYRGAAPINWAVIRGEKETGVTTFFINKDIDTGSVLFQESLPIGENETAGELHDRMMLLGAQLVLKTVHAIAREAVQPCRQDDSLATYAPKIFHDTCRIDFNQPCEQVHNFIRGMSPYPGAWMMHEEQEIKVLRATKDPSSPGGLPGTIFTDHKTYVKVQTADGAVCLEELQLQGRRRMPVREFLNGFRFHLS